MKYQKTKTIGHNHIRRRAAHKQRHLLASIDLKNTSGSIDHPWLLAIMEDIAYPKDVVELIGNICRETTTSFFGYNYGTTPSLHISPYDFVIFLEPLLRCLERDKLNYHFNAPQTIYNTMACADDLDIITDDIHKIQPQITKLQQFAQWAHMDLNLSKCTITGCPNKCKLESNIFISFIQAQKTKASPSSPKTNHTCTLGYILYPH